MRRALAALVVLALSGCATPSGGPRPDVVASFYPVGYFAQRIAGEHLRVEVLVGAGVEPHDYELKPTDQADLAHARLVVLQGSGLESFQRAVVDAEAARGVPVVVAGEGVANATDPHAWLDPVLAAKEADAIGAAIAKTDPANATAYRANLAALRSDLGALDAAYRDGLARCAKPKIIATHAAFGYLAREYNFTQFAVSGFQPDAEPSAAKVHEVEDIAKRENITVIFFETLVSPRVAQVVADEVHGRAEVLDPLEGLTPDAQARGDSYLTIMRQNLDHLRDAMECA